MHDGRKVVVTAFSANHCPGSCLFLIEDDEKRVIYTGDMRAEPDYVRTLLGRRPFRDASNALKQFETVYLDTTFCSKAFYAIPPKVRF
jgi:mRNA degradation ribonuclease J1/J2